MLIINLNYIKLTLQSFEKNKKYCFISSLHSIEPDGDSGSFLFVKVFRNNA